MCAGINTRGNLCLPGLLINNNYWLHDYNGRDSIDNIEVDKTFNGKQRKNASKGQVGNEYSYQKANLICFYSTNKYSIVVLTTKTNKSRNSISCLLFQFQLNNSTTLQTTLQQYNNNNVCIAFLLILIICISIFKILKTSSETYNKLIPTKLIYLVHLYKCCFISIVSVQYGNNILLFMTTIFKST